MIKLSFERKQNILMKLATGWDVARANPGKTVRVSQAKHERSMKADKASRSGRFKRWAGKNKALGRLERHASSGVRGAHRAVKRYAPTTSLLLRARGLSGAELSRALERGPSKAWKSVYQEHKASPDEIAAAMRRRLQAKKKRAPMGLGHQSVKDTEGLTTSWKPGSPPLIEGFR